MKKRVAKKILKQLASGRSYKTWRKGTLYKANDTLYGRSNRGMISMLLWTRASHGVAAAMQDFGASILKFAGAVQTVSEGMKHFRRFAHSPHQIQGPSFEITTQNLK